MNMKTCLVLSLSLLTYAIAINAAADNEKPSCPKFLDHEFRKLHSKETINLCEKFQNKPMLIVNTASHCGYTKQFAPLEKLYQKYRKDGFNVIGFASNAFNQAAKDEASAAGICYKNYGVTFTMLAPTEIKGKDANPVFAYLGGKTQEPRWNFSKYLVSHSGIQYFGSSTKPLSSELETALVAALK